MTNVHFVTLEDIMGQITLDQSHQIMAALATNADWGSLDFELLGLQDAIIRNPTGAGREFTDFLRNRARLIVGEPKIIQIDRSKPFNPAEFIGKGWDFWRGPIDGDGLSGDLDEDPRSLAITQLDLSQIRLVTTLKEGETIINGEEKQWRLKAASYIRLDLGIFQTFWNNQRLIPQLFRELTSGGTTYIFFDGQPLRNPNGYRYVLYLYFDDGEWYWYYYWLGYDFNVNDPSAVLASPAAQAA
jgi:hypothetical protein